MTATEEKGQESDVPFYLVLKHDYVEKKSLNMHVGMDVAFNSLEKRKVASNISNSPIELNGQFYTFNLLVSFADRIELYSDLGAIDTMKFIAREPGLKTTLQSEDVFLRGAGVTVTLFSFGNGLCLFSDSKYRGTGEFKIDNVAHSPDLFPGANTSQVISNSQAKYEEWQTALGLSKELFFRKNSTKKFIIFLGGIYSEIESSAKGSVAGMSEYTDLLIEWTLDFDFGTMKSKDNIGGFTGFSFISNGEGKSSLFVEAQCRFIDELSFNLRTGYRF